MAATILSAFFVRKNIRFHHVVTRYGQDFPAIRQNLKGLLDAPKIILLSYNKLETGSPPLEKQGMCP